MGPDPGLDDLTVEVIAALTAYPHYIRIPGFGDDRTRGKTLARMVTFSAPLHPRKAFAKLSSARIRIDPETFAKEGDGTRYSQTEQALAAHTDSSFFADPHELVGFQMAVPDGEGGESFMVPARDAVAHLTAETIAHLRAPRFPFGGVLRPVLTGPEADPQLRYYRRQIDEEAASGIPLGPEDIAALDALDAALARPEIQHRFRLAAGEFLLMNNLRVLHGRTAMDGASRRLMYRVRAYAGCLL
ncbi:MAG: TauD/TfdA family dioxygenase [Micropepsaceae bacterium]